MGETGLVSQLGLSQHSATALGGFSYRHLFPTVLEASGLRSGCSMVWF